MDSKSIFASKTLWANLLALLAAVLLHFGYDLEAVGLDTEGQAQLLAVIMTVVNIVLRFATKTAVSIKPPDSGGTLKSSPLVGLAGLALAALMLAGCAVAKTETPDQKAFALYYSFVVAEEAAADVVESPETPRAVVLAIAKADAVAKPLADALVVSARDYVAVAAEIEAIDAAGGEPSATMLEKARAALAGLQDLLSRAGPAIATFIEAARAVPSG